MIEFNSNHVFVNYIKQILSTIELPSYKFYTKENEDYFNKFKVENNLIPTIKKSINNVDVTNYVPYVKDNVIQYYIAEKQSNNMYKYYWQQTNKVYTQKTDVNEHKKLKINNTIYDNHTHEYLGEYLRYKRDYEQIDLMPLYNCFSDTLCNDLSYSWVNEKTESKTTFANDNSNYKIYMLPVKLFKQYTIAIDCSAQVEICCGVYGKYQNEEKIFSSIPKLTYKKYSSMIFSKPNLYTNLVNDVKKLDIEALSSTGIFEKDLKMFIKLPASNNSSIVVLEGDYRNYNDSLVKIINSKLKRTQNYTVTNFDTTATIIEEGFKKQQDFTDFKPITPLQLLRLNTKKSYPFADRLFEYLSNNAIDSSEVLPDNIKRVQAVIELNVKYADPNSKVWDSSTQTFKTKAGRLQSNLIPKDKNIWDNHIRPIMYDKFNSNISINNNDLNHDILGYIDKDVEERYVANTLGVPKEAELLKSYKPKYISISGIDLYEDKNGLYTSDVEE